MALRVIRRGSDAAAGSAYHASTTVCSRPYARTAIARPESVSTVRSLCRKALCKTSLSRNKQLALPQVHHAFRRLRRVGDVRHHNDRLAEIAVEALHHRKDVGRRNAVEVAGG